MTNLPMKVLCTNIKMRPEEIPEENWLVFGEEYTVIEVEFFDGQSEVCEGREGDQEKVNGSLLSSSIGFKLAELPLDHSHAPYKYFAAWRFEPVEEVYLRSLMEITHDILNQNGETA